MKTVLHCLYNLFTLGIQSFFFSFFFSFLQVWGVMHLTKNIIKVVARVVNSCYLLAERVSAEF